MNAETLCGGRTEMRVTVSGGASYQRDLASGSVMHVEVSGGPPGPPGPTGRPGTDSDGATDPGDICLIFDNKLI